MRFRPTTRRHHKERALRVFFATDVHGSDRCYRKFLAAAAAYEVDVLVLGGDVAGKGLVPVLRTNGSVSAEVRGEVVSMPVGELGHLTAEINRLGFYPVEMRHETADRLKEQPGELDQWFRREIVTQVDRWCQLAGERLESKVRCVITPGNDDPSDIDEVLRTSPHVDCPERDLLDLGPIVLASLGDVTPTPWNTEREFEEEELAHRIDQMMSKLADDKPTMFNFHCPPYGSGLDVAAELDDTLKPVVRGGRPSMVPVGSTAVRDAIKRHRPTVALHGHIHESRGAQMIGSTLCLNPGSDYSADVLRGALVDIAADGSYIDFVLTTG